MTECWHRPCAALVGQNVCSASTQPGHNPVLVPTRRISIHLIKIISLVMRRNILSGMNRWWTWEIPQDVLLMLLLFLTSGLIYKLGSPPRSLAHLPADFLMLMLSSQRVFLQCFRLPSSPLISGHRKTTKQHKQNHTNMLRAYFFFFYNNNAFYMFICKNISIPSSCSNWEFGPMKNEHLLNGPIIISQLNL